MRPSITLNYPSIAEARRLHSQMHDEAGASPHLHEVPYGWMGWRWVIRLLTGSGLCNLLLAAANRWSLGARRAAQQHGVQDALRLMHVTAFVNLPDEAICICKR